MMANANFRWLAVLVGAVLAGCASGPRPKHDSAGLLSAHTFQCRGNCDVAVVALTDPDGTCEVVVFQDTLVVHGMDRKLTWKLISLDGESYRFKADTGIEFKSMPDPGDLDMPANMGHDKFSWRSRNPATGHPKDFPYSVNVQRDIDPHGHTQDCEQLDPKIVNGGD
jgi:hypothetical protein